MNATVRRLENNLVTLGTGVIAFGIWSVLKVAFEFFLGGTVIDADVPEELRGYTPAILIVFWVFTAIELAVRIYIGVSSRADGMRKRKSKAYLVWSIVLMIDLFLTAFIDFYIYAFMLNSFATTIITLLIDGTSFFITLDLFLFAVRVRKLRRQEASQTNEQGGAAA